MNNFGFFPRFVFGTAPGALWMNHVYLLSSVYFILFCFWLSHSAPAGIVSGLCAVPALDIFCLAKVLVPYGKRFFSTIVALVIFVYCTTWFFLKIFRFDTNSFLLLGSLLQSNWKFQRFLRVIFGLRKQSLLD